MIREAFVLCLAAWLLPACGGSLSPKKDMGDAASRGDASLPADTGALGSSDGAPRDGTTSNFDSSGGSLDASAGDAAPVADASVFDSGAIVADSGSGGDGGLPLADSGAPPPADSGAMGVDSGTVLASGTWVPSYVATNGVSVYFSAETSLTTGDTAEVMQVPATGAATVMTLFATAGQAPFVSSLALSPSALYWTVKNPDPDAGVLESYAVGGTTDTPVTAAGTSLSEVAASATSTCWIDAAQTSVTCTASSGGAVTIVASGLEGARALAMGATRVYWIQGQNTVVPADCAIMAADSAGGAAPVTLVPSFPGAICELGVDATSLYFNVYTSSTGTSALKKMPLGGGPATTIDAQMTLPDGPLVSDGSSVYWLGGEEVVKVSATGGAEIVLASNVNYGSSATLAVDATSLYFGNIALGSGGDEVGEIVKLTPK